MKNYLCKNCRYNNNGWCNKRSFNGLKKITDCEYYKINDYTVDYNCSESTLENIHEPFTISKQKTYKIDFDKVNTINDIKLILEAIRIGFNINFVESYEKFDEVKKFLIEVE